MVNINNFPSVGDLRWEQMDVAERREMSHVSCLLSGSLDTSVMAATPVWRDFCPPSPPTPRRATTGVICDPSQHWHSSYNGVIYQEDQRCCREPEKWGQSHPELQLQLHQHQLRPGSSGSDQGLSKGQVSLMHGHSTLQARTLNTAGTETQHCKHGHSTLQARTLNTAGTDTQHCRLGHSTLQAQTLNTKHCKPKTQLCNHGHSLQNTAALDTQHWRHGDPQQCRHRDTPHLNTVNNESQSLILIIQRNNVYHYYPAIIILQRLPDIYNKHTINNSRDIFKTLIFLRVFFIPLNLFAKQHYRLIIHCVWFFQSLMFQCS